MRSLRGRVRRIEDRAKRRGGCAVCGGKKWVSVVIGDEEPRPPCPRCGNPPLVIRIVQAEPPPGWADRWGLESEPGA